MRQCRRMLVAGAASLLLVVSAVGGAAAGGPSGPTVIANHLNNPRQLALGLNGKLLVAEAGKGGNLNCFTSDEGENCLGATGSITEVSLGGGDQHRIITGFLSAAAPDGTGAVGSDGVSAEHNSIFVQETFFPPDALTNVPNAGQSGKLLRFTSTGRLTNFADISAVEQTDPDHQGFDSDPYAVLALPNRRLVTDAAGNDILKVDHTGHVSVFAVLPNVTFGPCANQPNDNNTIGCDAVPTSLALGPNGHIWVGELGGLTTGQVLELDPVHGTILKTYSNLGPVTSIAVASDGTVYASEFSFDPGAGKVTQIRNDGGRTSVPVPFPAGLLLGDQGKVYVSAFSISPETGAGIPNIDSSGQVWRLQF